MGLAHWSRDASQNQSADPNAYLIEGQPAPTINNAIRGVMQSGAEWRDDHLGILQATRGVGEVYAVATYQAITSLTAPFSLCFTVDAENQGPAKLAVNGQTVKPLRRRFGRELGPGDLTPGLVYRVAYFPIGAYYAVLSPEIESPGAVKHLSHATLDPGWIKPTGQTLSRIAYAALFAVWGTLYGAGDGSTTFQAPDWRGRALFAPDDGAGRLTGAGGLAGTLGAVGGAEAVTLTVAQMPSHGHLGSTDAQGLHNHGGATGSDGGHTHVATTSSGGLHQHGGAVQAGGGHAHTGSTDTAGLHFHNTLTPGVKNATAGPGSSATALWSGDAGYAATTDYQGNHTHTFTTDSTPNHVHGIVADGTHTHTVTVTAVGAHTHAISADGSHAHTVTTVSQGGDAAHPSVPPGAIATLVIKT